MKLKLSRAQMMCLFELLGQVPVEEKADEWYDKLTQMLVLRMYTKFRKAECEVKIKYSIKISEEEAIAFFLHYATHDYPATSLTGHMINSIRNKIHQQFI